MCSEYTSNEAKGHNFSYGKRAATLKVEQMATRCYRENSNNFLALTGAEVFDIMLEALFCSLNEKINIIPKF